MSRMYAGEFSRIRKYLAGHVAKARRSRAFDFRSGGSFEYAYALTWTPGSISLTGDCGEVTVVHYQALADLKAGLRWAAGSDYDYLLGKTNLRQSYDADATFEWLRDHLNEEAVRARKGDRKELQQWRRDRPTAAQYPDAEDLAEELAWWSGDGKPEGPKIEPRGSYSSRWSTVGEYEAPDGWRNWLQAWDTTSASNDPADIFTPKGRAAILHDIQGRCEQREDVYRLKDDLGIDDWYGSERWTFSDLLKIECVRRGARQALEVLKHEEFDADPYGWTATDFWGGSQPPRSAFVDWIAATLVSETHMPPGFLWGQSVSGMALTAAEQVLSDALDAASGGYNQAHHFVHTPGRYGQKGIDWSPEGAARMVIDWLADADLFWTTDGTDLPADFDYGVEPVLEEIAA